MLTTQAFLLLTLLAVCAIADTNSGVFAIRFKHTNAGTRSSVLADHDLHNPSSYTRYASVAALNAVLRSPVAHQELLHTYLQSKALPGVTMRMGALGDVAFLDILGEGTLAAHLGYAQVLFGANADMGRVRHGRVPIPVPAALSSVVDDILWLPPQPSKRRVHRSGGRVGGQFPGMDESPLTIATLYQVPIHEAVEGRASQQAVAEFEGEQFHQADLFTFGAAFNLSNGVIPTVAVVGPNNGGYFDEGILDLEYIIGVASGAPTYWVAKNAFDILGVCDMLLNITPSVPQVLSISWGSGESTYASASMNADNDEFKKLGLLGVSVLAASGDAGTGAQSTSIWGGCDKFDTNFPASASYCTSVGATYTNAVGQPEASWSGSGGGFSSQFQPASYQTAPVQGYLDSGVAMPPPKLFNSTGRPVPDVAAVGTNFKTCSSDYWGTETGTSAATPTFAALITRVNAKRLASGKATLGFLNPYLYAFAAQNGGSVGQDITSGNNRNDQCTAGFNCAKGWDPISGLGTPNYPSLETYLLSQ